jgi:hypothetical protein
VKELILEMKGTEAILIKSVLENAGVPIALNSLVPGDRGTSLVSVAVINDEDYAKGQVLLDEYYKNQNQDQPDGKNIDSGDGVNLTT